jgi:ATP-dependent DNA ligase
MISRTVPLIVETLARLPSQSCIIDGEAVACKFGLERIVSKRKDSFYRSGRSPDWLKMKNADAPAVKREAEEDWTR